jgi:nucleoside-diphosphate-sugar epimerase
VKVLVTGATGHLGREVVALLLQRGHEVVAVSRSGSPDLHGSVGQGEQLQSLRLDLAREDAVAQLRPYVLPDTAIVHLAATRPHVATVAEERGALLEANVFGTLRVLDAARRQNGGASVVVYACDAEVYGSSLAREPLDEAAFLRPNTDYAVSKLSGEDHLFAFEFEEQVRCVSLRFGAFYGSGARTPQPLTALLEACARREPPVVAGHADERCARIHVRDAARAVERALLAPVSGRFNIADGEPQSLAEAARLALTVCGATEEPRFHASGAPARRLELELTRARTELGFEASLSLTDALREEWQRLQGLV